MRVQKGMTMKNIRWIWMCVIAMSMIVGSQIANGQLAAPRIVGGGIAIEHEFPWQIWLHPTNYNGVYCGASLINSSWALTAAHCVAGETASTLVVELGMHNIQGSNPLRQTKTLSQIIVHPQYNSNTQDYDMALLHFTTPATINSAVAPITLAASTDSALYAAGVNAIVSGWGTTSSSGAVSYILRKVTVPIVTNASCNTSYGGGITARMVCAGLPQGGVDSCQGDSGGPLFVNDGSTPKLVGVVSWGEGCAAAGKPGVYANVQNMRSWIAGYVPLTTQPTAVPTQPIAPSQTAIPTSTPLASATRTVVATQTAQPTAPIGSVTQTAVVTATNTRIVSSTRTATNTRVPLSTRVPSRTRTASKTRVPSSTRTATKTATPRPDYFTRVTNGDFEAGNNDWTESSTNYPNIIMNDARIKARSGKYYAWLGGNDNETSLLSQSITVQSDAPYLRLYYMLSSKEKCGNRYDTAQIAIDGVIVPNGNLELCARNTAVTWKPLTIDLTSQVGQTVTLSVTTTTDESIVSSLWIDDIGFVRIPTEILGYYGKSFGTTQSLTAKVTKR